jgi:hypothetical protein
MYTKILTIGIIAYGGGDFIESSHLRMPLIPNPLLRKGDRSGCWPIYHIMNMSNDFSDRPRSMLNKLVAGPTHRLSLPIWVPLIEIKFAALRLIDTRKLAAVENLNSCESSGSGMPAESSMFGTKERRLPSWLGQMPLACSKNDSPPSKDCVVKSRRTLRKGRL